MNGRAAGLLPRPSAALSPSPPPLLRSFLHPVRLDGWAPVGEVVGAEGARLVGRGTCLNPPASGPLGLGASDQARQHRRRRRGAGTDAHHQHWLQDGRVARAPQRQQGPPPATGLAALGRALADEDEITGATLMDWLE
ncbi:hypothetical protein ZWY2020_020006 [Hordeum vulgare]|nr:hypothetical protein ZWY2020_020006 [Hordeum vulgare]